MKDYKYKNVYDVDRFFDSLEVSTTVYELARQYNQVPCDKRRIRYIPTNIFIEMENDIFAKDCLKLSELLPYCNGNNMYFVEPKLEGEFIKFNNNGEFVNHEQYSATIQAFSHWTYYRSAKRLVVNDLQGVVNKEKNEYILTDPVVVHESVSKMYFSSTNGSQKGIEVFRKVHACNSVCQSLGLEPLNNNTDLNGSTLMLTRIIN